MSLLAVNKLLRSVPRIVGAPPAPPSAGDWALVREITASAASLRHLDDTELAMRADGLREDVTQHGRDVADARVVGGGFALVNESVRRCLGWEFYDVQFLAAMALIRGEIAEMATGEGKTLVQALAAFVLNLPGEGVHVMTSNAFLAERDFRQLRPVLEKLDTRTALIGAKADPREKRAAYRADVTYGPGYEFGFDYLRDQVSTRRRGQRRLGERLRQQLHDSTPRDTSGLQRGHAVAIVDEADSVMIDEATTPLCLSSEPGMSNPSAAPYLRAVEVADELRPREDYVVNGPERSVRLTKSGLQSKLVSGSAPAGEKLERPWPIYVEQALVAQHLFCRDVDYVVERDRIALVDQSTGRIFEDRALQQGLHQAIEAKERITITSPLRTEATISRQRFFRLYRALGGMTGTARGAAREFQAIYGRRVRLIPTRNPCQRIVLTPRYFATTKSKTRAIVDDVQGRHAKRQPVLVGTRTIDESQRLAKLLAQLGIPLHVLNGVQDGNEAEIVSRAGQSGSVTIATNLAGRGTDIRLGDGVDQLGGLHVIATEVHTSARVDRQLIGRTARQGNPGSCQVFVSAEDELIKLFGRPLARTMKRLANDEGEITRDLAAAVARVQKGVEKTNFERRRQLLRHGAWVENVLSKLTGQAES